MTTEYDHLIGSQENFCGCTVCREDTIIFVLNRLPAQYVAHPRGSALSKLHMGAGQTVAKISVLLLEAFRRVAAEPSEECERANAT